MIYDRKKGWELRKNNKSAKSITSCLPCHLSPPRSSNMKIPKLLSFPLSPTEHRVSLHPPSTFLHTPPDVGKGQHVRPASHPASPQHFLHLVCRSRTWPWLSSLPSLLQCVLTLTISHSFPPLTQPTSSSSSSSIVKKTSQSLFLEVED